MFKRTNNTRVRVVVKKSEVPNPPGSSGTALEKSMRKLSLPVRRIKNLLAIDLADLRVYKTARKARKKRELKAKQDKHSMAKANRGALKSKGIKVKKADTPLKRK